MAYNGLGLTLGRGQVNDQTTSSNMANHRYISSTDTLATIADDGYFPANLNSGDNVQVNDTMVCRGTDTLDTYTITVLDPFTIVPLAEATGNVTGPTSSTTNAIAKFADASGKVLANTAITIDGSNDLYTAHDITSTTGTISGNTVAGGTVNGNTVNANTLTVDDAFTFSGETATFGSQALTTTNTIHAQCPRDINLWLEADTGDAGSEAYHPALIFTQDGNTALTRFCMTEDNRVRIDMAPAGGSPTTDFIISNGGTLAGGGVPGTLPTITPGTTRFAIPGGGFNVVVNPGLDTGTNVTFTTAAANPGGATTLWVRTSDGHLMFGSTDLTP